MKLTEEFNPEHLTDSAKLFVVASYFDYLDSIGLFGKNPGNAIQKDLKKMGKKIAMLYGGNLPEVQDVGNCGKDS